MQTCPSSAGSALNPMIRLRNVSKVFQDRKGNVHALVDINLDVMPGDIYGIIGFSGAGKSTLVRCINLLERLSGGQVFVGGVELSKLDERGLRNARKSIGMIFQQFNLMRSRTIFQNVAFPLRHSGLSRKERREKVMRLLKIVGLEDRADAYPAMLSGGQKQRVAIARALASDPKVLLCDEATSALDPQTTQDILTLLKSLNRDLGITIIVITHEMAVVKQICNTVAVMENGRIVEKGDIYSVFSNPQMPITRRFIATTDGIERARDNITEFMSSLRLAPGEKVVQLSFHGNAAGQALVSRLSRDYGIDISIVFGNMEMLHDQSLGRLLTVFRGDSDAIQRALSSIDENSIQAEVLIHA